MSELTEAVEALKIYNEKAAGFVLKEIVIIETSLATKPDKLKSNKERLTSLCDHVSITFKKRSAERAAASSLISKIKRKIDSLITK